MNGQNAIELELPLFSEFKKRPEKKRDLSKKNYSVISLFSGCGGLDLGFYGDFAFKGKVYERNHFEIVKSVDFDGDAVSVFNANKKYFKNHECDLQDVREIDEKSIPDYDILLAGFPCQPFSNAGNREGVNDKYGRGTLFYECERFIKAMQSRTGGKMPAAFVFENVRGILSSTLSDGSTVPEEIRRRMLRLGYNSVYKLFNMSDYGVPQNRYRVIIIGVRDDLPAFDFRFLDKAVQEYGIKTAKNSFYDLCLGSVLCDIPRTAANTKDIWQYSPSGQRMIEEIGSCPDGADALTKFKTKVPLEDISPTISQGRSWKNMAVSKMTPRFKKIYDNPEKYHSPNFYRRFALGEVCGTITASGQPENSGITHPFENRRFSVREIARIQSFPDDFVFSVKSIANAYKVIGNAVPPVFAWVLAKAVEEFLDKHEKDR